MDTPKQKSNKRRYLIGSGVAVAVAAGGIGWWTLAHRVPPPDGPAMDVVRFVADDRFKNLPGDQKQAYVDRLEAMPIEQRRQLAKDAGLTKEQGRAAYKNVYDQAVRSRINKYFALKTDAQKAAYLDHLIDEFKREQAFTKPEGGDPGKLSNDPGRLKERLESVPAGDRAKAASFMQDFMKRAVMRGLGLARPAGR